MEIANVFDRAEFSASKHVRTVLKQHDKFKTLVIGMEPGQEIPSCVMNSQTIFYVVQGAGTLTAGQEKSPLIPG